LSGEEARRKVSELAIEVQALREQVAEAERLRQEQVAAKDETIRTLMTDQAGRKITAGDIDRRIEGARTLQDIVVLSKAVHTELRWLPSALKHLDFPSRHSRELWNGLFLLDELAASMRRRGSPDLGSQLLAHMRLLADKLDVRMPDTKLHDSAGTIGRFGHERTFRIGDQEILFRKHMTVGHGDSEGCVQAYWEILDDEVVIGYLGPHLSYVTE
jgi:hypothetical protein